MSTRPPRWRPVACVFVLLALTWLVTPTGVRAYAQLTRTEWTERNAQLRADSAASMAAAEADAKARGDSVVAAVFVAPTDRPDPERDATKLRLWALLIASLATWRLIADIRALRRTETS